MIVIGILVIVILLLISYIIFFQLQLRSINLQLTRRLEEHTRQLINVELMSKTINRLAVNLNKCLKAEETSRINIIRNEKQFKGMIANISHDLRTPLTAIKGYQQLIEKEPLSDYQKEKLRIAKKHTDELGKLIEHFFEYAYLVNAELTLKKEKINLTNTLTECLAESITVFEDHNLTIDFEESSPIFIIGDKEAVVRIIQNLIRNCIQHTEGNVKVRIFTITATGTVTPVATARYAVISFQNSISDSSQIDVDRLFERFYTSDNARSKTTGLGLSIVKLLCEQMGGKALASLKEGSLEIRVELPLNTISYNLF